MPLQLKFLNDLRQQKADDIGTDRGFVSRTDLLRHSAATDQVPLFEDQDLPALLRQEVCTNEAVVSGTDDDAIVHESYPNSIESCG